MIEYLLLLLIILFIMLCYIFLITDKDMFK